MFSDRPRYRVHGPLPDDYNTDGPAFSNYSYQEGPQLNRIGILCKFLRKMGLTSPDAVFRGEVKYPKFPKKLKVAP